MVATIDRLPAAESETTKESEVIDLSSAANGLLDAAYTAKQEAVLPENIDYQDRMDDDGNHFRRLEFLQGGRTIILEASSTIHEPWNTQYVNEQIYTGGGVIIDEWSSVGAEVDSTIRYARDEKKKDLSIENIQERTGSLAESTVFLEKAVEKTKQEKAPKGRLHRLRRALGQKAKQQP